MHRCGAITPIAEFSSRRMLTSALRIAQRTDGCVKNLFSPLELCTLTKLPSLDLAPTFVTEIEPPNERIDDLHLQPILRGGGAPRTAPLFRRPFQAVPDVLPDSPRP